MSPLEATAAILAMGLVTYGTRIGGILVIGALLYGLIAWLLSALIPD